MYSPIATNLGSVLYEITQSMWRENEFELYSWDAFPEILVFDTASYAVQAQLFKRLAFFVEKHGFAGSLLSDDELRGRHGWNAHNYHPADLARFYNRAAEDTVELTALEHRLRTLLLENGVITEDDGGYAAGAGGIISVSRESAPALRHLLLTHEALHGVYYAVPPFRQAVESEWEALSAAEQEFWRYLFSVMSYNPEDGYLVKNEFQAYLLQQEPQAVHGYFRTQLAPRLKRWHPRRSPWIEQFLSDNPTTFRDSALRLAQKLTELTGFSAGRLVEIPPLSPE